jgi:hypothetical protein
MFEDRRAGRHSREASSHADVQAADICRAADVAYWHFSDMPAAVVDVRC